MRGERPINADAPSPQPPEQPEAEPRPGSPAPQKAGPKPPASPPAAERSGARRGPRRRSLTPFLLLGLVVIAVGFILAAVLGGGGGGGPKEETGFAVVPAQNGGEEQSGGSESEAAEALGFPSFATDNTTRVGGSDPAANAAAVALAIFPSTSPDLRPPAVTLVGEEDWAAAIAAAVLMAPPVRAPLLFSAPDEVPEATAEALDALEPAGEDSAEGAAAYAIGGVAAPVDGKVTKVVGSSPAALAAAIAILRDRLAGSGPKHVVIAPLSEPEFAAPAAAWAARSGDPVLFTGPGELPRPTLTALRAHPRTPAFVLGPPAAISAHVVAEIERIDGPVKRISGKDPVAAAVAFARFSAGDFGWNVNDPGHGFVLARAEAPLDAAAASGLSAAGTWGPLLLTDSADMVPAELRSYLLDVKPGYTTNPTRAFYNHVWVIGDQEAIDVNQQAEVNELAELAKIGGEE